MTTAKSASEVNLRRGRRGRFEPKVTGTHPLLYEVIIRKLKRIMDLPVFGGGIAVIAGEFSGSEGSVATLQLLL